MSEVLIDLAENEFKKEGCRGIVVDGTGFGYDLKVKQKDILGREDKGDKTACEGSCCSGVKRRGRERVLGIFVDDEYSDERKMLVEREEFLREIGKRIGGKYCYGDRLYGKRIKVIETLKK